jgi:hypothetical protein
MTRHLSIGETHTHTDILQTSFSLETKIVEKWKLIPILLVAFPTGHIKWFYRYGLVVRISFMKAGKQHLDVTVRAE